MSEIELFRFEANDVRVVQVDGEPWWVASDACAVLGLVNVGNALARLDGGDKSSIRIADGTSGNPNRAIVNESGLYDLILDSRKPQAKAFRRWITGEVIPSIRKTGSYAMVPKTFAEALELAARQARELEAAKPAIEFHQIVTADAETWLTMEQVAKEINSATGLGRNTLMNWMRGKGYLTKDNLPAQHLINSGKARTETTLAVNGQHYPHALFTQAGVDWIIRKFKSDNDKD